MLAKAHITIGLAAAFTIMGPDTAAESLPVIAGASLGCLICDIDCENKAEKTGSSHWRLVMTAAAAAALAEDFLLDAGMWRTFGQNGNYLWFAGLAGFVLTCTFASISSHRGFSHSLLALVLETASLYLIFPMAAEPFAIAFISHLILDLMNKRPVRLLYPAEKGFRLGWFYADRIADKVFTGIGCVWLAACMISIIRT